MRKARAVRAGNLVRQTSSTLKKALRSTTVSGFAQTFFGAVFGIEQRVEAGDIELGVQVLAWRRYKSPTLTQHIDDLVAQDGEQPSLHARFAAEALDAFERGEQCFLGGVVGRSLVADLQ